MSIKKISAPKLVLPYARHYNPLLIWNRSWILTIHKVRILQKKLLKKTFLAFKNGVKSIQTAGYNGARTVYVLNCIHLWDDDIKNCFTRFLQTFFYKISQCFFDSKSGVKLRFPREGQKMILTIWSNWILKLQFSTYWIAASKSNSIRL